MLSEGLPECGSRSLSLVARMFDAAMQSMPCGRGAAEAASTALGVHGAKGCASDVRCQGGNVKGKR